MQSTLSRLKRALLSRLVFSKTILFIWGLILSHSLVEYAVVNVLIDYVREAWQRPSLREAAMVVNLLDGLSAMLTVVVTHMAEAYVGLFSVNIFCTGAYAMGFLMLWVFYWASNAELNVIVFAMIMIAVGKAGKQPVLREFLDHQLNEKVKKKRSMNVVGDDPRISSSENRNEDRSNLWWRSAWISGAAIATFLVAPMKWIARFKISTLVMGVSHMLLYSGFPCYYPEQKPTRSPLVTIYRVFKQAFKKRNLPYPSSKIGYYSENSNPNDDSRLHFYSSQDGKEVHLLPRVWLWPFTFLDKAAINNNNGGEVCTIEQVREVKSLYPVIPMASAFFAYSLVSASGNTYFVEQFNHLDTRIGSHFDVRMTFFFVLKSLARQVVDFLVWWLGRWTNVKMIGIGLFCAVLCSIAAWQVELRRLSLVHQEHKNPDDDFTIPLHVLVLTPQYVLLGFMEALAENGLEKFFYDYTPKSIKRFGQPFVDVTLGIGKFNSILCVLILRSWFKESIDTSHMDRYFLFLAILSFVFFSIYVYLYAFADKSQNLDTEEQKPEADDEDQPALEEEDDKPEEELDYLEPNTEPIPTDSEGM